MKPVRWRLIFVSLLTMWAIYIVSPTIIYFLQPTKVRNDHEEFNKKVPTWLPQKHAKLGLDLQGGVQLSLGVNTESALESKLDQLSVDISRWAKDQNLPLKNSYVVRGEKRINITLAGEDADTGKFNEKLRSEYPNLTKVGREGNSLFYSYQDTEVSRIEKSALQQAERVVRSRVDQWGVSEPSIFRRADGSILVQLPGFKDPKQAKKLLGRTAELKFKLVAEDFDGFDQIEGALPEGVSAGQGKNSFTSENRDQLISFLGPYVPKDKQLLFKRKALGDGSRAKYLWTSHVVNSATLLTGSDLQDAQVIQGRDGRPEVNLRFTGPGGKRFADITGQNINKRLAIVLDDIVESDPSINMKISGGSAVITLNALSYSEALEEATQLAMILKSGAIPAKIEVLEERQVGATLGPELANQGIKGTLIGLLLVVLFMLFYYRRPGAIACVALTLNGLFLLALMSVFGFSLTLPGIAGFILTLGMAVDANVLINERIRQEIREGKNPRKSIQYGFDKVFWTIIDANLTTLIAAFVLLETNGSGPIRGFAITLIIGLLVSLFTSLYCSRLFFDVVVPKLSDKQIRFWILGAQEPVPTGGKLKPRYSFNFMAINRQATVAAFALGIVVLGTTFSKGVNWGVDFAGGTEVLVGFEKDVESSKIAAVADKSDIDGMSLQALDGGKRQFLLRYDEATKESAGGKAASASEAFLVFKDNLVSDLGSYSPEILQVDFVGPQVGKELRTRGILSVLYAIFAVLLYIAFRFDMRFAPGAVVKMFLDIFIMLGFYVFFGASFDLVAVAAFLTVVGYSVNDTIVIYDRIRENIEAFPRQSLKENINISLNETLSRTINTSLTTMISLLGILIFAKGAIWEFAMAMGIGVFVATCTSTFVSSSFIVWLEKWQKKKAQGQLKTASS